MRKILLNVAVALGVFTAPAAAQSCGPREAVIAKVTKQHYARKGLALAGPGNLIELYVRDDNGWVILATNPQKVTCVLGAGSNWNFTEPDPKIRKQNS